MVRVIVANCHKTLFYGNLLHTLMLKNKITITTQNLYLQ